MIIELQHPTDPRYVLADKAPDVITMDDLRDWKFGKTLLFAPGPIDISYPSIGIGVWKKP